MNPTPNCPLNSYEYQCTICDVDLVCHLDYFPAEKGSTGSWGEPLEPDLDESMDLLAVYVAQTDVNITSLMTATFLDQIERQALVAFKDKAP